MSAYNMRIGGALVTVFEPSKKCARCELSKPISHFNGYKTCGDCRAIQYDYSKKKQAERNARMEVQREQKRRAEAERLRIETEREAYREKCYSFYNDHGNSGGFEDWMLWYNDTVTKDGKYMPALYNDIDAPDFDFKLWHEALMLWDSMGKSQMPEGWEPDEERDFPTNTETKGE